jgi:hypothetical protein
MQAPSTDPPNRGSHHSHPSRSFGIFQAVPCLRKGMPRCPPPQQRPLQGHELPQTKPHSPKFGAYQSPAHQPSHILSRHQRPDQRHSRQHPAQIEPAIRPRVSSQIPVVLFTVAMALQLNDPPKAMIPPAQFPKRTSSMPRPSLASEPAPYSPRGCRRRKRHGPPRLAQTISLCNRRPF